jgi:hypothetical protein
MVSLTYGDSEAILVCSMRINYYLFIRVEADAYEIYC